MQHFSPEQVKLTLFSTIDSLAANRENYLMNPLSDFTRTKKISFNQTMIFPMIAGSDAGFCYVNFGEFHCELYEYEKLGLPILEILKLATVNPAAFMGKTGQLGCLTAGADADIAVFRGCLFRDLHKLDEPAAVYKKGIRYL